MDEQHHSGGTAGWYDDPTGRYQQRYWDGMSWTQHVRTEGRPYLNPLFPTSVVPHPTPTTPGQPGASVRSGANGGCRKALTAALTGLATFLLLAGVLVILVPVGFQRFSPLNDDVSVKIYLRDGADSADVDSLQQSLTSSPLVERVSYTSKDQAFKRFKEEMADSPEIIQQLEGNPLPASFAVTARDSQAATEIAEELKRDPVFLRVVDRPDNSDESLEYGRKTMDKAMTTFSPVLRILGFLFLVPAVLFGLVAALLLAKESRSARVKLAFWAAVAGLSGCVFTAAALYTVIAAVVPSGILP